MISRFHVEPDGGSHHHALHLHGSGDLARRRLERGEPAEMDPPTCFPTARRDLLGAVASMQSP